MSCYFCGGSRIASIHSAPDRGVRNWSVGSMTLTRRYDGEPIVRVELDTSVTLDVSVNGSCGDIVSADVMADFKSGHGLTFRGDDNWLVCPRDLADELHDKMLLPLGVRVYCPDNGGSLRLRYDLGMRGAGSLREDSTLCLLWAMLMDSYSRWRTTGAVFIDTGEDGR